MPSTVGEVLDSTDGGEKPDGPAGDESNRRILECG